MSWSGRSHLLYVEDMRDAMMRTLRYCHGLTIYPKTCVRYEAVIDAERLAADPPTLL